jgi:hypothetical protein
LQRLGALALSCALGSALVPWVAPALVLILALLAVSAGNRLSRAARETSP